jgi:hypothetical protein
MVGSKWRWKRDGNGCYRLLRKGVCHALVERSATFPWMWWWTAWSVGVDATGTKSGMRAAKAEALAAVAKEPVS